VQYITIMGFFKVLYFLRIFEQYGFFVQMLGLTVKKLVPFTVYFAIWVFLFSFMFKTLRVTFDGSGFPEVDSFLVTLLQTF
jgi:hypothetical protein